MKWLVTFLTLVAFAAVPTLAQAKPTPSDSNQYSDIPYLSHGVGVDESDFGGTIVQNRVREIPYLSHGVGVDEKAFVVSDSTGVAADDRALPRSLTPESFLAADDRALSRSSTPESFVVSDRTGVAADDRAVSRANPEPTPIVVTKTDGWSVDFGNSAFTALALMIGLLAGGTVALMWGRRGRLTPA